MSSLSAITVGNFDGVHGGHSALIHAARSAVGAEGIVTVLSFDPHPRQVLAPGRGPARLTHFERRAEILRQMGADEILKLVPNQELLGLSPDAFLARVVNDHRPSVIVEGPDFRFGRDRAGTVETLIQGESKHGYRTIVIDPVEATLTDGTIVPVSSSLIRWTLERGRVRDAEALLDRPYQVVGTVVQGDKRGRTIGVPTANLDHGDILLPSDGVYSGRGRREDGSEFDAAISVGTKPTYGTNPRVCEAHLLGYEGPVDDYGWTLELSFGDWVRDQLTFGNVEALVDQLKRDLAHVRSQRGLAHA